MKTEIILADKFAQYLSDVIKDLPSKVLFNKGITGCGGTTLEIKSKRDSLILVPNINLVINKTNAHSNLIGVYGETSKLEFMTQFKRNTAYKKIISTYDSIVKVIDWVGDSIYDYFLLIDEYHILFNSYSFRYEAINTVLSLYDKFTNYCFMTATPLSEENILEEIKSLDRVSIEWPQAVKVTTTVKNVYHTSKALIQLIEDSKDCDYNLHIFINSINTIRAVIKAISVTNFRTICSKNAAGTDKKLGGKLKVESINSPVKKINFYTATAFEGVDIYDPVGKTVVVSDTNISQSLVDISTLFIQICGRLRDSIYKDQALLICNLSNHRYLQYKNKQEFENNSANLVNSARNYEREFALQGPDKSRIDIESWNEIPMFYQDRYIGKKDNMLIYDHNLKKVDYQNYDVLNRVFSNTISVMNQINSTNKAQVREDSNPIYMDIYNALPELTLEIQEAHYILYPIFKKYNIDSVEKTKLLSIIADKKWKRINNINTRIYDFTKLKFLVSQL